jgi:hypothetical protein
VIAIFNAEDSGYEPLDLCTRLMDNGPIGEQRSIN